MAGKHMAWRHKENWMQMAWTWVGPGWHGHACNGRDTHGVESDRVRSVWTGLVCARGRGLEVGGGGLEAQEAWKHGRQGFTYSRYVGVDTRVHKGGMAAQVGCEERLGGIMRHTGLGVMDAWES